MTDICILGAGVTGLAAALASGGTAYEAAERPGGICSSYYMRPGDAEPRTGPAAGSGAYRFEIGGGHWIFGGDPVVLRLIDNMAGTRRYSRKSAVFFPDTERHVPYPLQNHLGFLDIATASTALAELFAAPRGIPQTMEQWLVQSFGPTLTDMFFGPFHEAYTAGLWTRIAPQDGYKSPVEPAHVISGTFAATPAAGYNATFLYPAGGLDRLADAIGSRASVSYGKRAIKIDTSSREVHFGDGSSVGYRDLISTLPLNAALRLAGVEVEQVCDPHTSVLVLNVGAERGRSCPDDHWIYVPRSRSGFHRIGFYSNVDPSFLPGGEKDSNKRVSIYVERAYASGQRPSPEEAKRYEREVISELTEWGFIGQAEVAHPTWIDVAYTWNWPGSKWRAEALSALEQSGIQQIGRYGRWNFQGIAQSIGEGLMTGSAARHLRGH